MKTKCILPNGVDIKDLKKYHPTCEVCGGQVSVSLNLGSGELWRDSEGDLYLSFIEHDAATGLLALTEEGFVIASKNVCWPITRLPEGTILEIVQQK